jgi:hypothetical protein
VEAAQREQHGELEYAIEERVIIAKTTASPMLRRASNVPLESLHRLRQPESVRNDVYEAVKIEPHSTNRTMQRPKFTDMRTSATCPFALKKV